MRVLPRVTIPSIALARRNAARFLPRTGHRDRMTPRCLIAALLVLALAPAGASAQDDSARNDSAGSLKPAQAGREAEGLLRELRRDQARSPAADEGLAPSAPVRNQAERMRREMAADRKKRGPRKAARQDGSTARPITRGICIGCR
jgi:hypothetical protein